MHWSSKEALPVFFAVAERVAIPVGDDGVVFFQQSVFRAAKGEAESSWSCKVRRESGIEQILFGGKPLRKAGPAKKQEEKAPCTSVTIGNKEK